MDVADIPHNEAKNRVKIIMLGHAGVGKTSLIQAHLEPDVVGVPSSTIAVDIHMSSCRQDLASIQEHPHDANTLIPVKLWFWDTAGQERFWCFGRRG
jgi:GTPase SAR1 family protein